MMKTRKRKKDELDFDNDPEYQKLVVKLRKIIDEAKARGIFFDRDDLFECRNCGAYEDVLSGEGRPRTFLKSNRETSQGFIVVDRKEQSKTGAGRTYFTTHYRFICGVCGIFQTQTFRVSFKN